MGVVIVNEFGSLIKYSIVGSVAFVIDFSVFYMAITFAEAGYLVSGVYSFVVGVFVNYILAKKYVFYDCVKVKKSVEVFGVYIISGVGLFIHQLTIYMSVEFAGSDVYIAKILASIIVLLWNYSIRRKYLYSE